jgi:AcrR family transcriptional regulator
MVMRYFGSKAGLFTAAATTDLDIPDLTTVAVRRRAEVLVRHFVERWEHNSVDDALVFLLRTAVTNEAVAERLQTHLNELVIEPIAALGVDSPDERGALIGTQLLGLALCRYILHLEPLASLPIEVVVAAITPTIRRYLTQPVTARPRS